MTKDEALDLALEALEELNNTNSHWWQEVDATTIAKIDPAIAAIKQALANEALDKMAENARELGLDYEPAPVLYQLPDDLYDSKDWKVGSYAERVEWLHTMYEAKKRELEYCLDAAPVQEPVAWCVLKPWLSGKFEAQDCFSDVALDGNVGWVPLYTTPPAAQDLQTELEATNRQVEILSDALAESRREVAAQRQSAPDPKDRRSAWVGLTDEEIDQGLLRSDYALQTAHAWRAGVVFAMTQLKEKNT